MTDEQLRNELRDILHDFGGGIAPNIPMRGDTDNFIDQIVKVIDDVCTDRAHDIYVSKAYTYDDVDD